MLRDGQVLPMDGVLNDSAVNSYIYWVLFAQTQLSKNSFSKEIEFLELTKKKFNIFIFNVANFQ